MKWGMHLDAWAKAMNYDELRPQRHAMARLVGFIWIRMHSQHCEKNRSPGFAVGGMQLQTIQELQELLFAVQKFEGHIGPLRFFAFTRIFCSDGCQM